MTAEPAAFKLVTETAPPAPRRRAPLPAYTDPACSVPAAITWTARPPIFWASMLALASTSICPPAASSNETRVSPFRPSHRSPLRLLADRSGAATCTRAAPSPMAAAFSVTAPNGAVATTLSPPRTAAIPPAASMRTLAPRTVASAASPCKVVMVTSEPAAAALPAPMARLALARSSVWLAIRSPASARSPLALMLIVRAVALSIVTSRASTTSAPPVCNSSALRSPSACTCMRLLASSLAIDSIEAACGLYRKILSPAWPFTLPATPAGPLTFRRSGLVGAPRLPAALSTRSCPWIVRPALKLSARMLPPVAFRLTVLRAARAPIRMSPV